MADKERRQRATIQVDDYLFEENTAQVAAAFPDAWVGIKYYGSGNREQMPIQQFATLTTTDKRDVKEVWIISIEGVTK